MIRNRFHATAAAGLATGCLLVAAPAALAAPLIPTDVIPNPRAGAIEFGSSNWKLSSGAASKLKSGGVTLKGLGSGDNGTTVKGSKIEFEAATSEKTVDPSTKQAPAVDPTTFKGDLVLDGGLSVKGRKTVKLTDITLSPGIEKTVTAKLGSKLVELGSLKGGKAKFSHVAQGDLTGATFALSAGGAKKLNAAVGGGFKSGSFATVEAQVITRELPIASGVATLTLDPSLLATLQSVGADVTPTPPATRVGNAISIPLTAGAFDPEDLTGRMVLTGDVTVGQPGVSVKLFGWTVIVNKAQKDLYAQINDAVAAPLASIDVSTLKAGTNDDGTFYGTGGKLTLSKVAAQVLTSQFHVTATAGSVLGTVDIAGKLSGIQ